ncbi:hypothetical protein RHS01_08023 [Rhizoctonia solani]|uniref:Uncharacterized protein n=1 Tax=Rhizoctonia solani TaxID=456999 RepID=A0A8H7LZH7_9AGAM|nr:hypothetical protein RHS01_08023 [Rhizoctonia solani]
MKYIAVIYLLLLPQLALGTPYAIVNRKIGSAGIQKRSAKVSIENELGRIATEDKKIIKVADNGIKNAGNTKGVNVLGNSVKATDNRAVETAEESIEIGGCLYKDISGYLSQVMSTCAVRDCNNNFFMNEAMRWIVQAIKDTVQFVRENHILILLLIGSFLLVEFIGSSTFASFILKPIGFGPKGPIKDSFASNIQRIINPVESGSLFSKFQSSAMRGAAIPEIEGLIHLMRTRLVGIGFAIIALAAASNNYANSTREWREWLLKSKVKVSSDTPSNADASPMAIKKFMPHCYLSQRELNLLPPAPKPEFDQGYRLQVTASLRRQGGALIKALLEYGIYQRPLDVCLSGLSLRMRVAYSMVGYRRKFARLMGLAKNDDWRSMCESTPAIIDGKNYSHPSHCDDKGVWGIYGVFDLMDKDCECSCGPAQL